MTTPHTLTKWTLWGIGLILVLPGFPTEGIAQPPGKFPSFVETLLKKQAASPPTQPRPAPIPDPTRPLWTPDQPARDWKYIVLHHSATDQGSVASIHQSHSQRLDAQGKPWRGIAYHFVIGNGNGMEDGAIEATFRWEDQLEGAHAGDGDYNRQGIGICLIGNFDQQLPTQAQRQACQRLIEQLAQKYHISRDRIVGHRDVKPTQCPGKLFPELSAIMAAPAVPRPAKNNRVTLKNEDAPLPVLK